MGVLKYKNGDIIGCHTLLYHIGNGMWWTRCNVCEQEGQVSPWKAAKQSNCIGCTDFGSILVDGVKTDKHYLYSVWNEILNRVTNETHRTYHRYGGRGISVHSTWINGENEKTAFQCFVEDIHKEIGIRPNMNSALVGDYKEGFRRGSICLGRKNHDINYQPGNIQWETASESASEPYSRYAKTTKETAAITTVKRYRGMVLPGVRLNNRFRTAKGSYSAKIMYKGNTIHIGTFWCAIEAHWAYCKKYRELYGEELPITYRRVPIHNHEIDILAPYELIYV